MTSAKITEYYNKNTEATIKIGIEVVANAYDV
jgi:hypothetical protein